MTATMANDILEAAIEYADAGIKVVRLYHLLDNGACSCRQGLQCPQRSRGKHPNVGDDWQLKATGDTEILVDWWDQSPLSNLGVLLGPESGIVDIEFDDDEGRRTATELLGECYTPTYRSGRSIHRWFKWNEQLPPVQKVVIRGLEIRIGNDAKGTQSVAPPSTHWSGVKYEWLPSLSFGEVDLIEVPASVMKLAAEKWLAETNLAEDGPIGRGAEHWDKVLVGVGDGKRNDSLASFVGKQLQSLRSIDDGDAVRSVYAAACGWNQLNKPPLAEKEIKTVFESILKREQRRRINEETNFRKAPEQQTAEDRTIGIDGWRLEIVESDPPTYRLYSPLWAERTEFGFIVLNKNQMVSPNTIKQEALAQARYPLPANFAKIWNGARDKPGLFERLVMAHETIDAPREQKRQQVVAQWLYSKLVKATSADQADLRGRPVHVAGKGIYFGFQHVWQDMAMSSDRVLRHELSEVVQRIGCEDARVMQQGQRVLLRLCPGSAMQKLEELIGLQEVTGSNLPSGVNVEKVSTILTLAN